MSHSPALQWFALVAILSVAATFRFYGLDWDRGYLFHPDERQIMLVTANLGPPASWVDFFNPDNPLNPRFFAYGSFPIYLLKILGAFAPAVPLVVPWREGLVSLAMLGRTLSGLFDLGSIIFVFLLARRFYGASVGLMAAACSAVTVLQIQLSHFYTVDTVLTFFVTATIYFAARFAEMNRRLDAWLTGASFGLAMATKVSALPLAVPLLVAVAHVGRGAEEQASGGATLPRISALLRLCKELFARLWSVRFALRDIIAIALAVFLITQPYALLDPIRYFGQIGTESLVARGWLDYPYTRQFADTLPYVYPIWQSSVWGIGLPLGIFAWGGGTLFVWRWVRQRNWRDGFILSWALVYFLLIGAQYAKYPRYLLPLVPFLFLMASSIVAHHSPRTTSNVWRVGYSAALVCAVLYSLAFVSMYAREHPWLTISKWIYANVPAQSVLAIEHWDDALPVTIYDSAGEHRASKYQTGILPMYDADDATKLDTLVHVLSQSDYVVLASQRLSATLTRLPDRYPMSSRYYALLFEGGLGFELQAHAVNGIALDGLVITDDRFDGMRPPFFAASDALVWNWGRADESFTVYDHPLPLVFKKTRALSGDELRTLLTSQ